MRLRLAHLTGVLEIFVLEISALEISVLELCELSTACVRIGCRPWLGKNHNK